MAAASATPHGTRNNCRKSIKSPADKFLRQKGTERIGRHHAQSQDHDVEQALRAGAGVLGKIFIHENIDRGEKERVTNAVQNEDQNDQRRPLREKGENGEAHHMRQECR